MFSQRSIMIGFIILIVACLVMYGCSSTSIKEGISNFGGNSAYYTSAKTGDGYIYSTEAEADAACKSVGWDGLCRKVDVPTKCACGWYAGATAADVGYHMDANTPGWGEGGCGGTSTDWITCAGKGGAYCCGDGPEVAALNPGYLPGDDLAHEGSNYIYKTQAEAEAACKAAGWDGLCKKKDVPSKCAAGWYAGATPDDVGYHMDPNTPGWGDVGCGDGSTGWIHYFPGGKAGAYCCGGGPKCPNLSGSWSSTTGGYTVKITQDNCNWTAISPSQPWSPAHGKVSGTNLISATPGLLAGAKGWPPAPLSGNPVNSIAWHDGDTWTRKSPPSSTPQMLCVTGAAIGKTGISPNGTYTLQSDNPPWWLMQSSVNDGTINWTISQGSVEGQSVVPTGTWWFLCGYKDRVPSGGGGSGAGDALGCWNSSQIVGTKPVSALKLPPMGVWKVGQGTDAGNTKWQSFKGNICLSKCPPPKNACPNLDKNACIPGFDAVMAASYKKANKKEDCRNLCNNTSDCTYWGWWPQNITVDDIQQSERSQMGFASSQDVPGACWLGSGSPSWTQTPTQSNTMYQKLCSWGGKKNCSFTNVSLAKRKGNGGCNNWADIKIREGTQDTSGPRTCEQECLAQKSPTCTTFAYGVGSSVLGRCALASGSCDVGTNDNWDVYTPILCKSTTPPPPPKCPDGWEEVTYQGQALGADINGCGMDDCGDRFDKNNIQQCADWCTAAGNQCKSFTWAPVGGDEYVTKKISNTPVCTRYTSDQPNQVLRGIDGQEKQIMCKPSAPPPKGCVDSPTDWSTVAGSCQGGLTCEDYAQQGWCANGGKAWNWGPCGLQKFSRDGWDLGTDGKTAAEACCVCGGGTKSPPKGCGSNCCTGGGDTVNGQCCCNSNTTCGGEDCSYYDDGSGGGGGGGGGVGSGTLSLGKNAILLNVDKYSKKL